MKKIIGFILLLMPITISATSYFSPDLTVEELYDHSDLVALLEVENGETLRGRDDVYCGALYSGKILERFKGPRSVAIKFGYVQGLKVGGKYLVFLSKPGVFKILIDNTRYRIKKIKETDEGNKCPFSNIGWRFFHSGFGKMELDWAQELKYRDGFSVATMKVKFPDSIPKVEGDFGSKRQAYGMKWIRKDDVIMYLRKIMAKNE